MPDDRKTAASPQTEAARAKLDAELDRELEDTFPASDSTAITRSSPRSQFTSAKSGASNPPDGGAEALTAASRDASSAPVDTRSGKLA